MKTRSYLLKQLETKIYWVRKIFKCLGRQFLGISHFTGECAYITLDDLVIYFFRNTFLIDNLPRLKQKSRVWREEFSKCFSKLMISLTLYIWSDLKILRIAEQEIQNAGTMPLYNRHVVKFVVISEPKPIQIYLSSENYVNFCLVMPCSIFNKLQPILHIRGFTPLIFSTKFEHYEVSL